MSRAKVWKYLDKAMGEKPRDPQIENLLCICQNVVEGCNISQER